MLHHIDCSLHTSSAGIFVVPVAKPPALTASAGKLRTLACKAIHKSTHVQQQHFTFTSSCLGTSSRHADTAACC